MGWWNEFICYNCLVRRDEDDLGDRILDKNICRFCLPSITEEDVGFMIRFHRHEVKATIQTRK